jgi:tRNA nucleotidyltransferase (CCA-adding enzyme)
MCEILTIYYGSFINLIKAASKWNNARKSKISGTTCGGKEIIDAKNFYKGKNILMEMNKSKTYSPLILVDPVQKDRNAAAALSFEKYDIFRKKAIEFLKKPSEKFFEIHLFDAEKLKKDNIVVCVEVLDGKEDIVGAKTLKIFMFLKQAIIDQGFYVKESGWHWDKGKTAYLYFKINKELDKNVIVRGPPANLQEHVNAFKRKHKKTFVKDGIIYAEDKQKITKANDFIKSLLKKDYVLERAKSAKVL